MPMLDWLWGCLDAFESGETNPTLVVAHADIAPIAERLTDIHFGALVQGEKVGS